MSAFALWQVEACKVLALRLVPLIEFATGVFPHA
jgi:hypothetical protein